MNLPVMRLELSMHRDLEVLLLHFERNETLQKQVRLLPGLRWSKTLSAWYVPLRPGLKGELFYLLKGKVWLDYKELNKEPRLEEIKPMPEAEKTGKVPQDTKKPQIITGQLSELAQEKIRQFKAWMRSRRYSESTISVYCEALGQFLRFFNYKNPEEINNADLIHFNNVYIVEQKLSASFQNQVVNGVKLFFRILENRSLNPDLVHRPKRSKQLPNVLSKEEIKLILNAQSNLKHKLMLSLIYACGLRRGELLALKMSDVDEKRGLLIIRQGKGKKDRITPLSEKIYSLIENYCVAYKPKEWLFEGQHLQGPYDERSLASVLKQALEKCGIQKPVTLHWLRHSYATHLLESGTDLRYIQELLGHSRSTTTEIYTHVSNKNLQKIVSPFDSL